MPGIFISYRRDDVPGQVGRLFGRLAEHYGEDFVFMDVESINLSQDFETVIRKRISDCDVLLLAIGPKWRAERPVEPGAKDYLRLELDHAIAGKRPLGPLLIDRRDPLDNDDLPDEVRAVLASQALEIRHSTFDRDVDAVILGLERQGIRPPASHRRRRIESALLAAGWPYTWIGGALRSLSPIGVAAVVTLLVAGAAWLAGSRLSSSAYDEGVVFGDAHARSAMEKNLSDITGSYEEQIGRERRESLRISGVVRDAGGGVEGATVTLTNRSNDQKVSDTTDSRGVYNVDLASIGIAEGDVVRFEVTKLAYRTTVENVKYHDDFREFRIVLRK